VRPVEVGPTTDFSGQTMKGSEKKKSADTRTGTELRGPVLETMIGTKDNGKKNQRKRLLKTPKRGNSANHTGKGGSREGPQKKSATSFRVKESQARKRKRTIKGKNPKKGD